MFNPLHTLDEVSKNLHTKVHRHLGRLVLTKCGVPSRTPHFPLFVQLYTGSEEQPFSPCIHKHDFISRVSISNIPKGMWMGSKGRYWEIRSRGRLRRLNETVHVQILQHGGQSKRIFRFHPEWNGTEGGETPAGNAV